MFTTSQTPPSHSFQRTSPTPTFIHFSQEPQACRIHSQFHLLNTIAWPASNRTASNTCIQQTKKLWTKKSTSCHNVVYAQCVIVFLFDGQFIDINLYMYIDQRWITTLSFCGVNQRLSIWKFVVSFSVMTIQTSKHVWLLKYCPWKYYLGGWWWEMRLWGTWQVGRSEWLVH